MKKIINIVLLFVAASALLEGCVGIGQSVKVPVMIAFDPVIGHDTRAEEAMPFPEDRTFSLWAVNEADGGMVLNKELISHSTDGWVSSQQWPEATLAFEAYSPSDLSFEYSNAKGLTLNDFDCSKGQVDILVATRRGADVTIDDPVTLTFDHILSRVEFRLLHTFSDYMRVKVRKIEMIGFASVGDYCSIKPQVWSTHSSDYTYVVFEDEAGVEVTSDPVYLGDEFYTIPQFCLARLDVHFDVKYGEAGWIPQVESIEEFDTLWEPGTHYTYTLKLQETKLVYTTGISNWNNRE